MLLILILTISWIYFVAMVKTVAELFDRNIAGKS